MAQIDKPNLHFNTVLYNGNSSTQSITGVGFQPDFVWGKARSGTDAVYNHALFDAVRGSNKWLRSNNTNAEATATNMLTSFDSDGFSLGDDGHMNLNGNANVAWNWKANGAGSSNSDGSITSTVSANTTAGFSIVAWNGNSGTVGHGLGVKPDVIIIKSRQTANNWVVLHKNLTGGMDTNALIFNANDAEQGGGSGMAEPTSSVFTITGGLAANDNNVAYVFAEKKGYSKFGGYTGNNNSDGAFVYTGFKPAFVIVKPANYADNWHIIDTKRNPSNAMDKHLFVNLNHAENSSSSYETDFLSNGFKPRNTNSAINGSYNYIYMAFAEEPLVGSNNVPATAR